MSFHITAKNLDQNSGEILIYGDISDSKLFDDDVTPSDFAAKLKLLGHIKSLTVRINSYGGSVFAGQAIVAMLDRLRASNCHVTTIIDSIAASMASVISQAGDEVIMSNGAMMMIHKPFGGLSGTAEDLRKYAELLDKAENTLVPIYMRNFTGSEQTLRNMLKEETWLTSREAFDCGLCSRIEGNALVAASAGGYAFRGLYVPADVLKVAQPKIVAANIGDEKNMINDIDLAMLQDKAHQYDRLRDQAVNQALKNAIRAKGDRFQEHRERKILQALTFEEILAQSDEWLALASHSLYAGGRVSINSVHAQACVGNVEDFKLL